MYYKILIDGKSCHGGNMVWSLPKNGKPGKWHEVTGQLSPCNHGLHLATEIGAWAKWGMTIYEAEYEGEIIACDSHKVVVRKCRLLRETAPPYYWKVAQNFTLSIKSIPWFNPCAAPKKEWKIFETRDAAWDAARAAAGAAARDAARAAARDAAGAAAWDAARDAARAAARAAAGAAARDAAWAAARDAAGAAARDAAWDAAGAAAWDASWDAALVAQCIVAFNDNQEKNTKYALDRWEVWQMGYGLLCDVNGVFYVYRRP